MVGNQRLKIVYIPRLTYEVIRFRDNTVPISGRKVICFLYGGRSACHGNRRGCLQLFW
jgi:hypothetical protein